MADVQWQRQAVAQYNQLTPDQQRAALAIDRALRDNPFAGFYAYSVTTDDGRQVHIHTYTGMQVQAEYYRRGIFRRRITVFIVAIRPMDWPSTTDYEERSRR